MIAPCPFCKQDPVQSEVFREISCKNPDCGIAHAKANSWDDVVSKWNKSQPAPVIHEQSWPTVPKELGLSSQNLHIQGIVLTSTHRFTSDNLRKMMGFYTPNGQPLTLYCGTYNYQDVVSDAGFRGLGITYCEVKGIHKQECYLVDPDPKIKGIVLGKPQ